MCWGRRRHHSFYFPHPQFLRWFRDSNWRPSNQKPASLPPILLCECSVCASVSTLLCVCDVLRSPLAPVLFLPPLSSSSSLLLRCQRSRSSRSQSRLFWFHLQDAAAAPRRIQRLVWTLKQGHKIHIMFWLIDWSIDFIVHLSGKLSLASRHTINKVKDGLFKGYG